MAEEAGVEEVIVPSEGSQPETEQPEAGEAQATEEPVDDTGVPLKNRAAEAQRKARNMAKAEKDLITPTASHPADADEALKLVEQIAEDRVMKRLTPVLAKQFLMENPDAAEMIDDINRVRNEYPELGGIDKLDVAYKIARAERQDEMIRKGIEKESSDREAAITKGNQAAAEGTGRTKAPSESLDDRIANAGLKELRELEAMITNQQ